jgi:hypothetical protein
MLLLWIGLLKAVGSPSIVDSVDACINVESAVWQNKWETCQICCIGDPFIWNSAILYIVMSSLLENRTCNPFQILSLPISHSSLLSKISTSSYSTKDYFSSHFCTTIDQALCAIDIVAPQMMHLRIPKTFTEWVAQPQVLSDTTYRVTTTTAPSGHQVNGDFWWCLVNSLD